MLGAFVDAGATRRPDIVAFVSMVDQRKRLAGQVLRWRDGTVESGILCPDAAGEASRSEVVEQFGTRLAASLRQLCAPAKTTWLTLTAGHDSRLMLAAAVREGLPIKTGTEDAERPHRGIPRGGQGAPATGDHEAEADAGHRRHPLARVLRQVCPEKCAADPDHR